MDSSPTILTAYAYSSFPYAKGLTVDPNAHNPVVDFENNSGKTAQQLTDLLKPTLKSRVPDKNRSASVTGTIITQTDIAHFVGYRGTSALRDVVIDSAVGPSPYNMNWHVPDKATAEAFEANLVKFKSTYNQSIHSFNAIFSQKLKDYSNRIFTETKLSEDEQAKVLTLLKSTGLIEKLKRESSKDPNILAVLRAAGVNDHSVGQSESPLEDSDLIQALHSTGIISRLRTEVNKLDSTKPINKEDDDMLHFIHAIGATEAVFENVSLGHDSFHFSDPSRMPGEDKRIVFAMKDLYNTLRRKYESTDSSAELHEAPKRSIFSRVTGFFRSSASSSSSRSSSSSHPAESILEQERVFTEMLSVILGVPLPQGFALSLMLETDILWRVDLKESQAMQARFYDQDLGGPPMTDSMPTSSKDYARLLGFNLSVHTGFLSRANEAVDVLRRDVVQLLLAENGKEADLIETINLTGHSLGGTTAVLTGIHLSAVRQIMLVGALLSAEIKGDEAYRELRDRYLKAQTEDEDRLRAESRLNRVDRSMDFFKELLGNVSYLGDGFEDLGFVSRFLESRINVFTFGVPRTGSVGIVAATAVLPDSSVHLRHSCDLVAKARIYVPFMSTVDLKYKKPSVLNSLMFKSHKLASVHESLINYLDAHENSEKSEGNKDKGEESEEEEDVSSKRQAKKTRTGQYPMEPQRQFDFLY